MWMRFIRRTKQMEGDDGLDEVLASLDAALNEEEEAEGKKPLTAVQYRIKSDFHMMQDRGYRGRRHAQAKVWKPDTGAFDRTDPFDVRDKIKTFPLSQREAPVQKPRHKTHANSQKIMCYLFRNDGKHEGSGVICEIKSGGFHELCNESEALMQQPVRRIFVLSKQRDRHGNPTGKMDGYEISPGAGTTIDLLKIGDEIVVSGGEDFAPSDDRSIKTMEELGISYPSPAKRVDEEPERGHFFYDIDGHLHFGKELEADEDDLEEEYEDEDDGAEAGH